MCDEQQLSKWAQTRLNRRGFGAIALAGAAVTACAPAVRVDNTIALPSMGMRDVTFATSAGTMDAWFVHPASGTAPAVIVWPDIAGLREAKKEIGRRLAGRGYAALVLNQYYRDTPAPIWSDFADFAGNGGWDRARSMRANLTASAIMADARTAVAWLDAQEEVDQRRGIGVQGYCMGGPFAVWTAAAVPNRVRAAASFHGGGLVRAEDRLSPHIQMVSTDAAFLIAVARDDHAKAPADTETVREVAAGRPRASLVKVYDGDHGWTVADSPAFAPEAEAAAWEDLMQLYATNL